MLIECDRFVPLILRSADGTIAPDQQSELEAHVASCVACRDSLREQSAVRRLLGSVEMATAPRDFAGRVRARVTPQPGLMDLLNWRAWSLRLAPVAALLMLLAWYPTGSSAGTATASETLLAIVHEWAGTQVQVAGGVLLNAGSSRDALLAAALGETSQ